MIHSKKQLVSTSGLTLVELLVVLIILVGVGGLVIGNFDSTVTGADGVERTPQEVTTLATMQEVIKALVGDGSGVSSFYGDNFEMPDQLGNLLVQPSGLGGYSPVTKVGWNGPYLLDSGARYDEVTVGDGSDGFTNAYANDTDPVIVDGWYRPLVLQESNDRNKARLVSAGPDRVLDTDFIDLSTTQVEANEDRNDDIVKYIFVSDPVRNLPLN